MIGSLSDVSIDQMLQFSFIDFLVMIMEVWTIMTEFYKYNKHEIRAC